MSTVAPVDPTTPNCGANSSARSPAASRPIRGSARRLLERQRDFAEQPGGAVLDGRDIGTVIAPDATPNCSSPPAPKSAPRAACASFSPRGIPAHYRRRPDRHQGARRARRGRATAPLVQAKDADLLDTSELDIDAAIAAGDRAGRGAAGLSAESYESYGTSDFGRGRFCGAEGQGKVRPKRARPLRAKGRWVRAATIGRLRPRFPQVGILTRSHPRLRENGAHNRQSPRACIPRMNQMVSY